MDKDEIIRILEEIASLLELQNENPFKIRAYRNAARTLLGMEDFSRMLYARRNGYSEIPARAILA